MAATSGDISLRLQSIEGVSLSGVARTHCEQAFVGIARHAGCWVEHVALLVTVSRSARVSMDIQPRAVDD
jgi:hypothetical protein